MSKTLLIIDDDDSNCRLIKAIFSAEGMEVLVAHDGQSGIDLALSASPDILLLDLCMPGLDGLDVPPLWFRPAFQRANQAVKRARRAVPAPTEV